jgi:hypothetical protein
LFAAASVEEPSGAVTDVKASQNTFGVYIPIKKADY